MKKYLIFLVSLLLFFSAAKLYGDAQPVVTSMAVSSLPNENQQTMANSISVAVASDQSAIPVDDTAYTYVTVDTVSQTYDDNPTTATSQTPINCRGYRHATLSYDITYVNSPSLISIEVLTSNDGTHYESLIGGPWPLKNSPASITINGIQESYYFGIATNYLKVRVTCSGTTINNTFIVSNTTIGMTR